MKPFINALILGAIVTGLKFLLWRNGLTYWDLSLISISGLIAGIFFSLTVMFRSALMDYKEADKNICSIRGKVSAMNDINLRAAIVSKEDYNPRPLSMYFITVLKTIRSYLENDEDFNKLQDTLNNINYEARVLEGVIPANLVSRFLQCQDHLRGFVSYLEYGKSLKFARVGYIFLYFFIFALLVLQLFSTTPNIPLELIFIFSLSSVLIFFAELIRDLDSPFNRKKAAFAVDLKPLDNGVTAIERSLKELK